jgi:predicted MFS family arabinose efflux permease
LSDLIAYRQRGRIIGLATTCSAIGTILGVPAALYLAQLTGLRSTFLALAALVIVLEFLSRAWLAPATRRPAEAAVTSLPGGWRNLCNSRRVRLGLLVWFLWSFVNGLPYTFMAAWLEDELQFQIGQTGLIWSSIGLGSCLGFLAVAVWSDRWGKRRFALIGLFANLVAITLMSYVTAAWLVFPIVFVYSLTDSLGRGAYSVFITELAPTERASAIALYRGVMGVAALLTPVIGGLVWPVGGFRLLALVVAGLGGLALLLATRWLPEAASDGPRPEWGRC